MELKTSIMNDKNSKKFNLRVLVVDDYPVNLDLTKEMLEMLDCEVDGAENGKEALRLYNENVYDCIFLDVQMPEFDGLQVAREIRNKEGKNQHVPIIALTANALQGDEEKCLEAGMDGYIAKPIKMKDLENVLSQFTT